MKRTILLILTILTLAFIWGHSMMSVPASASESGGVLELIRPLLEIFVGKGNATNHLVRKLAHFAEYGTLGLELGLLICAEWINFRAKKTLPLPDGLIKKGLVCLLAVFIVAFLDESIQILSGRGPLVEDIWLDLSGGAAMLAVVLLIKKLFHVKISA